MRHTKVIVAMVAVALLCASGVFAAEAEVFIDNVYTLDMMQDPENEFCVLRPVLPV